MTTQDLQSLLEMGQAGFGWRKVSAIAANNTTGVVVKAGPGLVTAIHAFNNGATVAYLKLYNTSSAALSTDTPIWRGMIPAPAAGGGGFVLNISGGMDFNTGISYRVTTGIADNDTGSPAATTYLVNIVYK